jgi:site-specific recombinase XerD
VLTVDKLLKLLVSTSITVPELVRVSVVTVSAMRDWVLTVVKLLRLLESTSITVPELVSLSVVMDGAMRD